MASSFVSYLGPFNREFRELLLARDFAGACARMRIPATPDLRVSAFLADEAEVGEWVIQVLLPCCPASCVVSQQSACKVCLQASRW